MPEYFRNDINKPINIDISPVVIKSDNDFEIQKSIPESYSGGYFFRYLNSAKNSRLVTEFKPNKIWEIKWQAALEPGLYPWFLLFADERIIVQNESGWQMFDTKGNNIFSSARTDGNLSVDINNKLFYQNEFSGFLQANNLNSGQTEFLVYPYFGKGYDRNVIWYDGNKFLCAGYEIPAMTHKVSPKDPDITLFEILNVGDKSLIDSDKILNSAQQVEKLILKGKNIKAAVSQGITIAATDNYISVIDDKLNIKKIFHGEFIPQEISLDEELNIYMIARVKNADDNSNNYSLFIINQGGGLVAKTKLPFDNEVSEFYPPILNYDNNVFILSDNRLISVDAKEKILWDIYLADSSPGASVSANNYLLTSEGNLLTAIDNKGERNFIFQFESGNLYTPALLTPNDEIYVATQTNLYCLRIKEN